MTGRREFSAALLLVTLVTVAAVGLPVAASGDAPSDGTSVADTGTADALHGNHVTVSRQVVADGRLVVEQLFLFEDGFVAVYADNGSEERLLGVRSIESGLHSNLAIETDPAFWAGQTGPQSLTVRLHTDDGDGTFDPEEDTVPPAGVGGYPTTEVTVRAGERAAVVVPYAGNGTHRTAGRELTIRRAALPRDGYLVLRATTDRQRPGRIVAATRLDAGNHENVTLTLDEAFFANARSSTVLYAELRRGGDSPATATPVRVGDAAVATRFSVRKGTANSSDGVGVVTATATRTAAPSTDAEDSGETPGFGVVAGVLGTLLAVLSLQVARRRG